MQAYNFSFNTIYIIQSLDTSDRKTGRALYDDLDITSQIYPSKYSLVLFEQKTKEEFFNALNLIKKNIIEKNFIPLIHLEMHGHENKKGLVLGSKEFVSWEDLKEILVEINYLSKNNLCLTLGSCFGAYMMSIINPLERAPVHGYIGAEKEVEVEQLYNYTPFYRELFKSGDLNEALRLLNLESPSYQKTNIGYYNSEYFFEQAWQLIEDRYSDETKFNKWVNKIFNNSIKSSKVLFSYNIAMLRPTIADLLLKNKKAFKEKIKDHFLFKNIQ